MTNRQKTKADLTPSELDFLQTSFDQIYCNAYYTFDDYVKIALSGKNVNDSIYG